ncbi:MAG TPA: RNA polymerase sigma factor [Polyangiaceae bacterium]
MTTPILPLLPIADLDPASAGVRLAVAGDPEAVTRLLRAVRAPVVAVIRRILGARPAEVDDATQQALIAFIHALPSYRGEGAPTAFAKTIAVRTALIVRRRWKVNATRECAPCDDSFPSDAPSPSDDAIAHRRRALLQQLLSEIPVEQAEALAMRIVLGWSLDEIASSAGVPLNTVRSRIRLAKDALSKKIEGAPEVLEGLGLERVRAQRASDGVEQVVER